MENAINTTEKQIRISENVKPFTELNRENINTILKKVVKEMRNCPTAVIKNDALYCIWDLNSIPTYLKYSFIP